jgi:predicted dehydrogenase
MSTACHCIMYLRYILDRVPVTRVYAELLNVLSSDPLMDDAAYVTIRYGGGQIGWVASSLLNALGTFDDRAEIHGTEGTIFLDPPPSGRHSRLCAEGLRSNRRLALRLHSRLKDELELPNRRRAVVPGLHRRAAAFPQCDRGR